MNSEEIIGKIKTSKKYKNLSEEVIRQKTEQYIKSNPEYERYKEKKILKDIKAILYRVYGSFQAKSRNKRWAYLEELKKNPENLEIVDKILQTNKSTKERIEIYPELYEKIFLKTHNPKSILDLGCGLNPVALAYLPVKNISYKAYDIDEEDIDFLNKFFSIYKDKIEGEARTLDISKIENAKELPKADLCLMFKLLDVLEEKGHKYSEELIKIIAEKCRFIIASFSTRTVGGNSMNFPYRGWIERMLDRIGLKFETFESEAAGEVFYIIKK